MEFSTEVSESVDDPFARNSSWKYPNNDQNVIQRARETGAVGGAIVITGWELCPQLANSPLGAALLPGRDPRGIAGRFLMMGGQFHPWHWRPSNDAESRSVESGCSQNGIHRCRGERATAQTRSDRDVGTDHRAVRDATPAGSSACCGAAADPAGRGRKGVGHGGCSAGSGSDHRARGSPMKKTASIDGEHRYPSDYIDQRRKAPRPTPARRPARPRRRGSRDWPITPNARPATIYGRSASTTARAVFLRPRVTPRKRRCWLSRKTQRTAKIPSTTTY
jgi:hypothetical protein